MTQKRQEHQCRHLTGDVPAAGKRSFRAGVRHARVDFLPPIMLAGAVPGPAAGGVAVAQLRGTQAVLIMLNRTDTALSKGLNMLWPPPLNVSNRAPLRRSERSRMWEKNVEGDPRILHQGGLEEFLRYEATVELLEQLLEEIVTVEDSEVRVWNETLSPSSPLRTALREWIDLYDESSNAP